MRCSWCGESFIPRATGGRVQRFCTRDCQRALNDSLRGWARLEWERGAVSTETLRKFSS